MGRFIVIAEMNNVTPKMLRHYDEIGLLKPSVIDSTTGYRSMMPNNPIISTGLLSSEISIFLLPDKVYAKRTCRRQKNGSGYDVKTY